MPSVSILPDAERVGPFPTDREQDQRLARVTRPTINEGPALLRAKAGNAEFSRTTCSLWIVCLAVFATAAAVCQSRPCLSNDAFQYLSVADNIRQGHGLSTSLVHFDEQRAFGIVPAPQTVFPPGYAVAVALVSFLGCDLEWAGLIVSAVSLLLLIPIVLWAGRSLSLSPAATHGVILILITNALAWRYAACVLSESLFTALSTGAVAVLLHVEARRLSGRRRFAFMLLAGMLAGLSYWVRYAGLFLNAALVLYVAGKAIAERPRGRFLDLLSFGLASGPLCLFLMLRNISLVGSFKGGNTKLLSKPLTLVLNEAAFANLQFLLGPNFRKKDLLAPGFLEIGFGLALLAAGMLLAFLIHRYWRHFVPPRLTAPFGLCVTYVGVYGAAILYAGKVTPISSEDPRMYYPILPVLLLVLARLLPSLSRVPVPGRRALVRGMYALLLLHACLSFRSLIRYRDRPDEFERIAAWLQEPVSEGRTVKGWLDAALPADAAVLATEGQACGYVLQRGVVSLLERHYCMQTWGDSELRIAASTFRAPFLILFRKSPITQSVAEDSPLIADLLRERPPAWMTLAARSASCLVYRFCDTAQ